jgi:hypothetical protein
MAERKVGLKKSVKNFGKMAASNPIRPLPDDFSINVYEQLSKELFSNFVST